MCSPKLLKAVEMASSVSVNLTVSGSEELKEISGQLTIPQDQLNSLATAVLQNERGLIRLPLRAGSAPSTNKSRSLQDATKDTGKHSGTCFLGFLSAVFFRGMAVAFAFQDLCSKKPPCSFTPFTSALMLLYLSPLSPHVPFPCCFCF